MSVRIIETVDLEAVEEAIRVRVLWRDNLLKYLPYADGGAYTQDKDRIADFERDIVQLQKIKEKMEES